MTWVKLDDRYRTHRKTLEAGAEGVALDVAAMCFAAENETDGFVPAGVVPGLYPVRNPRRTAAKLVDVGRWSWDEERAGYWIHDYLDYNPSAEELAAKRASTKDRVADWRNKKRGRNAGSNTTSNDGGNAVTPPVGNAGGTPSSPIPIPQSPASASKFSNQDSSGCAPQAVENASQGLTLEERLLSVCTRVGPHIVREASDVVALSRRWVDDKVIDEAVGHLFGLNEKPKHPRYVLKLVTDFGRSRGVEMPDLYEAFQSGRAASA